MAKGISERDFHPDVRVAFPVFIFGARAAGHLIKFSEHKARRLQAVNMDIPRTLKKLREARFFLAKNETSRTTNLEREDFEFYLSAFLSAARSVTFALQAQVQQQEYRSRFDAWLTTLSKADSDRLKVLVEQRNMALKTGNPEVQTEIEMVPLDDKQFGDRFRASIFSWPARPLPCLNCSSSRHSKLHGSGRFK